MNFIIQLKRSWAITKKDLAIYYLKGPVVIFGLFLPAFLFISFSLKRQISPQSLIPGLIAMTLFFTVSSITPGIMPWETRMKTLERLISAPISLWAIILGDIVASFLYGLLITFIIFTFSFIFLGQIFISLSLIIATILAAFCFSALGSLISVPPTDTPANTMILATLIKFPLVFISGIFVPLQDMGKFSFISFFSPLTYYTDLIRNVFEGESYFSVSTNLWVLLIFTLVILVLAVKGHSRTIFKRL